MIIKPYGLKNLITKKNIYLFYGENFGHKDEIIKQHFKKKLNNIFSYTEKEILNNIDNFYNQLSSKSFFENSKLFLITDATDKFLKEIELILDKDYKDITIVLISEILEKKSKLRKFFEKEEKLVIIPFYKDDSKTLSEIAKIFFREKKIPISQELVNLIVEKSSGDRKNLKNELNKIESFSITNKDLSYQNLLKLINLSENYSINELVNNCLAKNKKNTVKIINENIFSLEDCILITRSLMASAKRLLQLIIKKEKNTNIDLIISSHKPPIFWKDKNIIKQQIQNWSVVRVKELILEVNKKELLIKKNSQNALNIITDFIIEKLSVINN